MMYGHLLAASASIIVAFDSIAVSAATTHHGAEDTAHHGADHAATTGLPQLDPTWYASQVFWLALIFTVLYLAFSKNVLPTLSNILDSRHQHIQNDLNMAEKLRTEAEDVRISYEEILSGARDKASNMYKDIENDIAERSEKKVSEFQEKVTKELSINDARLEQEKKKALEEMDTIAAELASDISKKIVGIDTDPVQAKTVVNDLRNKAKAA